MGTFHIGIDRISKCVANESKRMEKFIESDPSQALLLPVDLREWVPAEDLSHFVLAAVERVPMHRFRVN